MGADSASPIQKVYADDAIVPRQQAAADSFDSIDP
jgi:hypothetical protein